MAGKMYNYLSNGTADYTSTNLEITPQEVLTEIPIWNQTIRKLDDGSRSVVTHADRVAYEVEIEFPHLLQADGDTITDFWSDPNKAMGSAKTFYWYHPVDQRYYVARFAPGMRRQIRYLHAVPRITLWIEAVKAVA